MESVNEIDFYQIYLVKKFFQIPLVRDRGFILTEEDLEYLEDDFTFEDFMEYIVVNSGLEQLYSSLKTTYDSTLPRNLILPGDKTGKNRHILVYFIYENAMNISVANLQIFLTYITEINFNYSEVLLFSNKKLKKKEEELIKGQYARIDFFMVEDSLCNPTTHALSNQCRRLMPEEKREFINEIMKKDDNKNKSIAAMLPRMSVLDVIVIYYGWNKDDIIEIIRDGRTDSISDSKLEYRIVT